MLQDMPPRVSYAQQVKNLLARGNDSGYTLPNEDEPLTPERFAAEILKLPGCRAWASEYDPHRLDRASVLVPGDEKKPYKPATAEEKLAALSPDDALGTAPAQQHRRLKLARRKLKMRRRTSRTPRNRLAPWNGSGRSTRPRSSARGSWRVLIRERWMFYKSRRTRPTRRATTPS